MYKYIDFNKLDSKTMVELFVFLKSTKNFVTQIFKDFKLASKKCDLIGIYAILPVTKIHLVCVSRSKPINKKGIKFGEGGEIQGTSQIQC